MNIVESIRIVIITLTLAIAMFTLGGSTILYMKYRTKILKLIVIFIISITLISIKFWSDNVFNYKYIVPEILSFIGCILCIVIIPYMVTTLVSQKLTALHERLAWIWNILYLVLGVLNYLKPFYLLILSTAAYMLLLTIIFWTIYLAINIKKLNNKLLKKSLIVFISLTLFFLVLLTLDFLITTLPIKPLIVIDDFSLTFYFLGINIGLFFFSGSFLNREAYIVKGKLSPSFLDNFKLTPREGEIIEKAYQGMTNIQIGEELFIAKKTVENHLSNIYQKMQIKNKKMLILELNTWKTV